MPIIIVIVIVFLLIALAAYAFISQSIEKKRIQKQRIIMTLKTRQRNLVHLAGGFPPNFLPNDLLGLLYRALIDTSEQLSKIEPQDPLHQDQITHYGNQLTSLAKNNSAQRARIDNPQAMKTVRQHLQELQRFLEQQETAGLITKVQHAAFSDQIQRIQLQMSVDAYIHQAKQAQQAEKPRLAIHFFTLANKLLIAENKTHIYSKQIAQLAAMIEKLEATARSNSDNQGETHSSTASNASAKEWESFAPTDDKWKKKQIYD